jgi:hypothetical protein
MLLIDGMNEVDGIRRLIDWVGEDHLAFGTDMDGL